MPLYEYYCKTCYRKFEKLLPISAAADRVECPSGHEGAVRSLSLVARTRGAADGDLPVGWAAPGPGAGGGCACGGACTCR